MSFEPSWALNIVLVCGLAALYVWYLLSEATIFDKVFAYPRQHWGALWNCPWCLGLYVTAIILITTGTYDPVTHLASAGVAGFLGSKTG